MDVIQLWWLSLAVGLVVTVVVAVLLGLIVAAAKSIDRHAEAIWTVGKEIAGHTVAIWMLDKTNRHLGEVVEEARRIERAATALDERLQGLAGSGRR
jgi:hypothetical protein